MMRAFVAAAAILAGLTSLPSRAHACFDGFTTRSESTSLTHVTDGGWSLVQARTMARWTHRIEALLPAGRSLQMQGTWSVELCSATGCESLVVFASGDDTPPSLDAQMARVFDSVAKALDATPRQRARARATRGMLYAVQIGSYRSAGRAQNVANELNMSVQSGQREWPEGTFYSAGGYPAVHPVAGVHSAEVGGTRFHRVVAGLFVDAHAARAHREALRQLGFASSISATAL